MDDHAPPGPPPDEQEPVPVGPRRPTPPWAQIALGAVIFVATVVTLLGLTGVIAPAGAPSGSVSPSTGIVVTPTSSTAVSSSTPVPTPTASPFGGVSPTASPAESPAVSPTPTGDPVLVGAGDIADCDSEGDEATAALLDRIPGTVFAAGDVAYDDGTLQEFQECYAPSWGRHLDRTWPVPGNHDWHTPDLAGYLAYFGDAATGDDGSTWYARDLGTWRVIMLDSECDDVGGCGPDSPQGRWLAKELAGSTARCTIAIFHVPRFSSGAVHGNDKDMDAFWRPLYAAGVDVIVNGHDHEYERFAPQDPDGRDDRAKGIREFVVGTGGKSLYEFGTIQPNSELRASIDYGVIALTLHDGSYDWQFHAATSDFSDRGSAPCH